MASPAGHEPLQRPRCCVIPVRAFVTRRPRYLAVVRGSGVRSAEVPVPVIATCVAAVMGVGCVDSRIARSVSGMAAVADARRPGGDTARDAPRRTALMSAMHLLLSPKGVSKESHSRYSMFMV